MSSILISISTHSEQTFPSLLVFNNSQTVVSFLAYMHLTRLYVLSPVTHPSQTSPSILFNVGSVCIQEKRQLLSFY